MQGPDNGLVFLADGRALGEAFDDRVYLVGLENV